MTTKVVITGASGNVGTALLGRLSVAGGYEVHGIARRTPAPTGVYKTAHWHQLDVAEPAAAGRLRELFRDAAAVVHLAWGFQPTRNVRYLDAVALGGSTAVLTAADSAGVGQLVHMSSVGTYAAGRYGQRVDESWSTAGIPSSSYSRAKSKVEALLDDYEQRNPDGVVVTRMRPGFILHREAAAGLRRYSLPTVVDPRWLRFLPVLPLDRGLIVPVVHADDVADAAVRAIERTAPGPFNLSAEPPVRRDDLAQALSAKGIHVPSAVLRQLVKISWRTHLQPVDEGWLDMAFTVPLLDTSRARTVLDWSPAYDSHQAMSDMGEGFMAHAETSSPALAERTLVQSLRRDLRYGPITTRRLP
jgi:nucleoside-diphosphate-sugar epimerase